MRNVKKAESTALGDEKIGYRRGSGKGAFQAVGLLRRRPTL